MAAGPGGGQARLGGPPRPDGLGTWAEHGQQVTFLLEYDTGSEHLAQLTGKLAGYGRLAAAMAEVDHACPLLLFCFPGPRREQAVRRALAGCSDSPALRIATTALDPAHASPAGPVWLPLLPGWASGPVALCALDAALPDPWAAYRAGQALAREQAARAHVPPPWPDDPYDDHGPAGPATAA
jgi:Replication-relaxation